MEDFEELLKHLKRDGYIDSDDVSKLRDFLFSDSTKQKEQEDKIRIAERLYRIKYKYQRDHVDIRFYELLNDYVIELLIEDKVSPGEISDKEAEWLRQQFVKSGKRKDKWDRLLLKELRHRSISYPSIVDMPYSGIQNWEKNLFIVQRTSGLAVLFSAVSAVVLFLIGSIIPFFEIKDIGTMGDGQFCLSEVLINAPSIFITQLDIYLFGMVMLILSVGIFDLFVNTSDDEVRKRTKRPKCLQVDSLDDLKSHIGKVILMALIVLIFKMCLTVFNVETITDERYKIEYLLALALITFTVAATLFVTRLGSGNKHK